MKLTQVFFGLFQVLSSLQDIEESTECCVIQDSSLEKSYSNGLPTSSTQGNLGKLQECKIYSRQCRKQDIWVKLINRQLIDFT